MIKVIIEINNSCLFSKIEEDNIKQKEIGLLFYEFENIKKKLLNYKFKGDVEVEHIDD